ncbi:V/A-type H+-transporting ATPase subunit E [Clostridiales Family XIII bacterium PM5-7]
MSVEKITSKILSDAEASAKVILDEVKATSDGILAEAAKKAEEIQASAEQRGKDEKEKLITRRKAVADIDGRKIVLEEKQKLISSCFDQAIEQLATMEKGEYLNFLTATIKKTGMTEGELILNEKDAKEVGNALVERLAKELPESKISLSKETRKMKGGFILKNGAVYINGTIEALVDEMKEALIGEVAEQLFQ